MSYDVRRWLAGAIVLFTLSLSACERPFLEELPPETHVVTPDLSTVLTDDSVTVRIEATSPRTVTRVSINEQPMTFNPNLGLWETRVGLGFGANRLVVTSEDEDGTLGRDTAFAVRIPHRAHLDAPGLPAPRVGHTATLLPDGDLLVTGGVMSLYTPARTEVYLLPREATQFHQFQTLSPMVTGRVGHTASLLPDGRVLLLGGSSRYEPTGVSDLVETVEVYDPSRQEAIRLPFEGQPIRRTLHTAAVWQDGPDIFIDLYGGMGDIRYRDDPRLGIRSDIRTFHYTGDSLVAVTSPAGAPFLRPAFGHIQAPTRPLAPAENGRYIVAGTTYGTQSTDSVSFTLDYTNPIGARFADDLPPFRRARSRAAATPLERQPGFVAVFGGFQGSMSSALAQPELYVEKAHRFFLFPEQTPLLRRFDHTATFVGQNRILLLGGFTENGNALSLGEFFEVTL